MKKKIVIILIIVIAIAVFLDLRGDKVFKQVETKTQVSTTTVAETPVLAELTEDDYMDIAVYVQDKEVAKKSDCRVTKKIEYTILKTPAVADVSLKILFSDELKDYGVYRSVNIVDGIANVMLVSDLTPEGKPIGSLSSCESGHLLSVLKDTLVQYQSVKSMKLFSPTGEIVF